jgi:uncharacterized protein (TIGR04255 family)
MEQRRRYKNPPIEEALCEFRFRPGQEWDLTMPGKLHSKIRDEYPGKPRQQNVVEAVLQTQVGAPSHVRYREGLAKVQLVTEDDTRMVAVGQDVLSVHMFRPYLNPAAPEKSGWEEFRHRLRTALDAYWSVAEPVGVHRIGIRYINKIVIPQRNVEIEEYLTCALRHVDGLPDRMNNFVNRVEYTHEDGVRLILSHGTVDAPQEHFGLLLDIDVIWEASDLLNQDEALAKADELRGRERIAFEALITDKSRGLFDAD